MSLIDPDIAMKSEFLHYLDQNSWAIKINVYGLKATIDELIALGWEFSILKEYPFPELTFTNKEQKLCLYLTLNKSFKDYASAHQIIAYMQEAGFKLRVVTMVNNDDDVTTYLQAILDYQNKIKALKIGQPKMDLLRNVI